MKVLPQKFYQIVTAFYRYTARDKPMTNINPGNLLEWNITTPTLTSTGSLYKAYADAHPPVHAPP